MASDLDIDAVRAAARRAWGSNMDAISTGDRCVYFRDHRGLCRASFEDVLKGSPVGTPVPVAHGDGS